MILFNSLVLLHVEKIFQKLCKSKRTEKDQYEIFFVAYRYVKNGDEQTFETIRMNVDELLYFLQTVQDVSCSISSLVRRENRTSFQQKILVYPSKKRKTVFSVQLITTREQIQQSINDFEPNPDFQKQNLLSFDGSLSPFNQQHLPNDTFFQVSEI